MTTLETLTLRPIWLSVLTLMCSVLDCTFSYRMEGVTAMVEKGLSLLRDHYASMFQRVGGPNVNVAALMAARMTLPFRWDDLTSMLALESMSLAHDRYQLAFELVLSIFYARLVPRRHRNALACLTHWH
jgi:hypothetical protein